jgi:hypothetical protein
MFCQGACSLLYILVYELASSSTLYILIFYTYILIKKRMELDIGHENNVKI